MEKFQIERKGYKKEEVNQFVSEVITEVESMLNNLKEKDVEISRLKSELDRYKALESSLNESIMISKNTSLEIKKAAQNESDIIIRDARRNASRIVNEALMEADHIHFESEKLKRNIVLFKKRLRLILENQLDMVDDIEHLDNF